MAESVATMSYMEETEYNQESVNHHGRLSDTSVGLSVASDRSVTRKSSSVRSNTDCDVANTDSYLEDEVYDEDDSELREEASQCSLLKHVVSQLRIGMELPGLLLPTTILERRSLLELYADSLSHADHFSRISAPSTAMGRMIQCLKWYLSSFHCSRLGQAATKPYSPILGETFRCFYRLPGRQGRGGVITDGPVPWCHKNDVAVVAEQVSDNPPVSAFYGENRGKGVSIDGYMWTKSQFLGLSIAVHLVGRAVISVRDYREEYVITFPSAYARSLLTVPWAELAGKTEISCAQSGYTAKIDFLPKPYFWGKKNQISAELYSPHHEKPICFLSGDWSGRIMAKYTSRKHSETFLDTDTVVTSKKQVKPRDQQGEFESRRLWEDVTHCLRQKDYEKATASIMKLEQEYEEGAQEREQSGTEWKTKYFHKSGEHWVYNKPLTAGI